MTVMDLSVVFGVVSAAALLIYWITSRISLRAAWDSKVEQNEKAS